MYPLKELTYSSKALIPTFEILHVVTGFFPLKDFVTLIYPAVDSLSNCTLKFPAVAPVFSFIKTNSAESTPIRRDMTANLSCECSNGSKFLNASTFCLS